MYLKISHKYLKKVSYIISIKNFRDKFPIVVQQKQGTSFSICDVFRFLHHTFQQLA